MHFLVAKQQTGNVSVAILDFAEALSHCIEDIQPRYSIRIGSKYPNINKYLIKQFIKKNVGVAIQGPVLRLPLQRTSHSNKFTPGVGVFIFPCC